MNFLLRLMNLRTSLFLCFAHGLVGK